MHALARFLAAFLFAAALTGCTTIIVDEAWIPADQAVKLPWQGAYWALDKGKREGLVFFQKTGRDFAGPNAQLLRVCAAGKQKWVWVGRSLLRGRKVDATTFALQYGDEDEEWGAALAKVHGDGAFSIAVPETKQIREWLKRDPPKSLRGHFEWNEKRDTLRFDKHACTKARDDVLAVVSECVTGRFMRLERAEEKDVVAYLATRADELPRLDNKRASFKMTKGAIVGWLVGESYACGRVLAYDKEQSKLELPDGTIVSKKLSVLMSADEASLRGDPVLRRLFRLVRER